MSLAYVTREDAVFALKKMSTFHDECKALFKRNGLDLLEDLGRRNILLSNAQEKFFAEALSRKMDVTSDGRSGEPDIVIHSLGRELECKLTSRHRSGAIVFQADYKTMVNKGSLDYLYLVASEDFQSFAVVHYTNLTAKDFKIPSSGARGKSQLMKYSAHDRANVLLGKMINVNESNLSKLRSRMKKTKKSRVKAIEKIQKSIDFWSNGKTRFSFELEKV